MRKWHSRHSDNPDRETVFMRHLDGNANNHDPANLECVHPCEAFAAEYNGLGWYVNWEAGLSEGECNFVRSHLWNFCTAYHPNGAAGTDETEALFLSQQADAAMEADQFTQAAELYQRAKDARDWALFRTIPMTGLLGRRSATTTRGAASSSDAGSSTDPVVRGPAPVDVAGISKNVATLTVSPLDSRRAAGGKASILTSAPSRRLQPIGAPTKREEVQARIAARNASVGR